jgi:L-cysteate sulfo-lyase
MSETLTFVAGHAGPAYGVPHAATIEAIRPRRAAGSSSLDPVYSGKGLAGLISLVRDGRWQHEDVVFIHTGGNAPLCSLMRGRWHLKQSAPFPDTR